MYERDLPPLSQAEIGFFQTVQPADFRNFGILHLIMGEVSERLCEDGLAHHAYTLARKQWQGQLPLPIQMEQTRMAIYRDVDPRTGRERGGGIQYTLPGASRIQYLGIRVPVYETTEAGWAVPVGYFSPEDAQMAAAQVALTAQACQEAQLTVAADLTHLRDYVPALTVVYASFLKQPD